MHLAKELFVIFGTASFVLAAYARWSEEPRGQRAVLSWCLVLVSLLMVVCLGLMAEWLDGAPAFWGFIQ